MTGKIQWNFEGTYGTLIPRNKKVLCLEKFRTWDALLWMLGWRLMGKNIHSRELRRKSYMT